MKRTSNVPALASLTRTSTLAPTRSLTCLNARVSDTRGAPAVAIVLLVNGQPLPRQRSTTRAPGGTPLSDSAATRVVRAEATHALCTFTAGSAGAVASITGAKLSEREGVGLDSGRRPQREHVVLGRGRRDQVVQALAIDAHDAAVDVGAGPLRRDAAPSSSTATVPAPRFGGLSTR